LDHRRSTAVRSTPNSQAPAKLAGTAASVSRSNASRGLALT
jgi:hypothetical protein